MTGVNKFYWYNRKFRKKCFIIKMEFLCTTDQESSHLTVNVNVANVGSVGWKSCKVFILSVMFFLNCLSSFSNILLMFLFTNMFEDQIWYFLNMRCKMEADDSRLDLWLLLISLVIMQFQSPFKVTEPKQQRKKTKL